MCEDQEPYRHVPPRMTRRVHRSIRNIAHSSVSACFMCGGVCQREGTWSVRRSGCLRCRREARARISPPRGTRRMRNTSRAEPFKEAVIAVDHMTENLNSPGGILPDEIGLADPTGRRAFRCARGAVRHGKGVRGTGLSIAVRSAEQALVGSRFATLRGRPASRLRSRLLPEHRERCV